MEDANVGNDFLRRDIAYRGRDNITRRKDGTQTPGKCTGSLPTGENCDNHQTPTLVLIKRRYAQDAAANEAPIVPGGAKVREIGTRPMPGTICFCGSKVATLTGKCLINEDHEVPPAASGQPPKLSRWT
jgi:hypothetical protein